MSTLSKLKFVSIKARKATSPTQHRQNKLVEKLDQQLALARSQLEGRQHQAYKRTWRVDPTTGERTQVETPKRIVPWYWSVDGGHYHVTLRYGARPLEVAKGRNAVEAADLADVVTVLGLFKAAVQAGEFDQAITTAVTTIRGRFKS